MIKAPPAIYRLLWIAVAVVGVLLLTMPLMLFSDDVRPHDPAAFQTEAVLSGLVGVVILGYSLWRLLRPLKAPLRE